MNDQDEYEFRFDAYTPKTIPMERLAKYLASLAKMMGNQHGVHFQNADEGSTKLRIAIDHEDIPKVKGRLDEVSRNVAANDAMAGFEEINALLISDNAVGALTILGNESRKSAVILQFPGRETPVDQKYGPFMETVTIDGELIRIGGIDASAHALIISPDGKKWKVEMSRDFACAIAVYLYKGPILRITGDVRWERLENGKWNDISFKMTDFSVLDDESLESVTQKLLCMHDTDWCLIDDIDGYIAAERGVNDGLH